MFKLAPLTLLMTMFFACSLAFSPAHAREDDPTLVLDMRNAPQLPSHFRAASELKVAGSAQFSKLAFDRILQQLRVKKIMVIDLREESHGLLNSNAISWYGQWNAANAGLSGQTIEKIEENLLTNLNDKDIAVVNTIQKKEGGRLVKVKPVEYAVHQVSSEREYVTERGSLYHRLYVQDSHAPTPGEVDRFVEIVRKYPKDQWILLHCRGGSGRTSTFMLMIDMLRNAKTVSLDAILARQTALGGKDLTRLPSRTAGNYQTAAERLHFLRQFYRYASENQDEFATSFSQWSR